MIVSKQSRATRMKGGFTLVEILTVLLVLSIMGGMVVTAVRGVTTTAREARTKAIIAACDRVIQEKYDAVRFRALPVEIPTQFTSPLPDPDVDIGLEVLADEAARVRLIMIRDLLRMELPDRYSDIFDAPVSINAACSLIRVESGTITGVRNRLDLRESRPVSWASFSPSSRLQYLSRLSGRVQATIEAQHQSAECLYLIMSTTFVAGSPAIDAIPASNIGDTDNDGVPEILDGWGRPLGFIRWPAGYDDPDQLMDLTVVDDFDPYRADWCHGFALPTALSSNVTHPVAPTQPYSHAMPWSLRPLILSAGEDELFGIALNPFRTSDDPLGTGPGGGEPEGFSDFSVVASNLAWPIDAAHMAGGQQQKRTGVYPYPDPFYRQFIEENDPTETQRSDTNRRIPGEPLSATDTTPMDDNITNFSLGAE